MSTSKDKIAAELNREFAQKGYQIQPCKTLSRFFQVADLRSKTFAPCAPDPITAVDVAREEAKFNL